MQRYYRPAYIGLVRLVSPARFCFDVSPALSFFECSQVYSCRVYQLCLEGNTSGRFYNVAMVTQQAQDLSFCTLTTEDSQALHNRFSDLLQPQTPKQSRLSS